MKNVSMALCAIAILIGSCKKSDNDSAPSGTALLTSGSWKVTATTAVVTAPPPVGTQTIDVYALMMQDCQKDNTYKFNADKSATLNEGATKCSPDDPQTESSGTWDLYSNDTKFKMTLQGMPVDGDVLTLNSTTLTVKYVTTLMGYSGTFTSTLTHVQ